MAKSWWRQMCDSLSGYTDETPALIVVTPLHPDSPPKPFTKILPIKEITDKELAAALTELKHRPGRRSSPRKVVRKR